MDHFDWENSSCDRMEYNSREKIVDATYSFAATILDLLEDHPSKSARKKRKSSKLVRFDVQNPAPHHGSKYFPQSEPKSLRNQILLN